MRRAATLVSVITLAALAGAPRASRATVLVDPGLEALTRRAYAVALVTPTAEARARWERGRIVTTTRVTVRSVLRGASLPASVEVDLPGGRVGEVAQRVEGTPALTPGAPVVLLVQRLSSGRLTVLDLALGALPVTVSPSGEARVWPARSEGAEVTRAALAATRVIPSGGEPLAGFTAWVRGLPR